jgi:hypothetical protein
MLRYVVVLLVAAMAMPAAAEVDRPTCDTARAMQVSYRLTVYAGPAMIGAPSAGNPVLKTICLVAGREAQMTGDQIAIMLSLDGATPAHGRLLIHRPDIAEIYVGEADLSLEWLELQDFDPVGSTDEVVMRSISPTDLQGKRLHIPLRRRHAYDPSTDGNWQYTPLQTEVFGELILQIGNSDLPIGDAEPTL